MGDAIGIVSPAGPVTESELRPGLLFLEKNGFQVVPGSHVFNAHDYLAGSDSDRLSDFEDMFRRPEIKALFCARGGYGSMRFLDRIDFQLMRTHPKILLGYSDITALLMAACQKANMVTFHGPMVKGLLSIRPSDRERLWEVLCSESLSEVRPESAYVLTEGAAEGRLLGGNLSLFCHLCGTPYMPSLKGSILFLEDTGEAPYRLDRMLTHLYLSGAFEGVLGLMLGRFLDCGEPAVVEDLVSRMFSHMKIPIVAGFPVGHGVENTTLPLGIRARLDTSPLSLQFLESPVI